VGATATVAIMEEAYRREKEGTLTESTEGNLEKAY
jgi:hypothetical protein